jgi:hypothetical protein
LKEIQLNSDHCSVSIFPRGMTMEGDKMGDLDMKPDGMMKKSVRLSSKGFGKSKRYPLAHGGLFPKNWKGVKKQMLQWRKAHDRSKWVWVKLISLSQDILDVG